MTKIRTRFAPSPTGRMHVGNLRTALYAYLVTKHEGGDFILRIEDTDQERLVEGAVDIIYRTLQGTGLIHDEGPDKDGGYGPYVQSERMKTGIYMDYANYIKLDNNLPDNPNRLYIIYDGSKFVAYTDEVLPAPKTSSSPKLYTISKGATKNGAYELTKIRATKGTKVTIVLYLDFYSTLFRFL